MRWRYVWMSTVIVTVLCFIAASSKRKNLESGSFGFSSKYHSSSSSSSSSSINLESKLWGKSAARGDDATHSSIFGPSSPSRGTRGTANVSGSPSDVHDRMTDTDEAMLPILHIHFIDLVDDLAVMSGRGSTTKSNRTKASSSKARCELRFSRRAVSAMSPALQEFAARQILKAHGETSENDTIVPSRSCFPHLLVQSSHPLGSQRRLSVSSDTAPLSLIEQLDSLVRRKSSLSRHASTASGVVKAGVSPPQQLQAPSVSANGDPSTPLSRRFSSLPRLRRFLDVLNETQALRAKAAADAHVTSPLLPWRRPIHFLGVLISHHHSPQAAQAQSRRVKRWNSWLAQFMLSHGSFGEPVTSQRNASRDKGTADSNDAKAPSQRSHFAANGNDRVEIISLSSTLCATGRVSGIRRDGATATVNGGGAVGPKPTSAGGPRLSFRQSEFCSSTLGCDGAPISDERVSACSNGGLVVETTNNDLTREIHSGRRPAAAWCCSRHHWPMLSWDDASVGSAATQTLRPSTAASPSASKTISGDQLGELFVRRLLQQLQRQRP